ncbi:MAG TPA: acetate--CoA ligase family protein [Streptosporangiaceae bacterium]|nr:acetate--CoA ligase family protein [Streptosporangiaceae bacterium]
MTIDIHSQPLAVPHPGSERPALHAMLEARSVAIVGASARPGSFGERMLAEAGRSPARPVIYSVNPRYPDIGGRRCYASVADLPEPADLVLLGVPDAALEHQLALAADVGCRSAVIFGNAHEDVTAPAVPGREGAADGDLAGSAPPDGPAGSSEPAGLHPLPAGPAPHSPDRADPARPGLRQRLATVARSAGMQVCGAGCMGFANVGYGLRAMGYLEPDPLPAGPIALVTHSGSVFSALLRTRRALGFTLAVSSGQELVTTTPSYLEYALGQPGTRVLALVLEAMREPDRLRGVLAAAAERDIPVVLLTAGNSASGRAMVAAHSGALAGTDGGWEALARAYGVHRVADLAEMADVLELFCLQVGRIRRGQDRAEAGRGIATVHDSGLERAHAADVAGETGVPFAAISEATTARLADLLDPGLLATNPLDVWGTGASTRELFGGCLVTLAGDDSVDAVALAVDLVTEYDADDSYRLAVLDAAAQTGKPVAVIANLASAIDQDAAARLRASGIPVLEGMRTGIRALGHLLDHQRRPPVPQAPATQAAGAAADPAAAAAGRPAVPAGRLARALDLLGQGRQSGAAHLGLLREYGIATASAERVTSAAAALAAARRIGYPVVLKTDEPGIAHKSDAGGVLLGLAGDDELAAAYADLAARLGPAALVCQTVPSGTELALGIVRDPDLGPLVVVGAGGILVELVSDRAVALPPLTPDQGAALLDGLKVRRLLDGARGARPADQDSITRAIAAVAELACELGDHIEALDVNPLICGPDGTIAVDALVIPR